MPNNLFVAATIDDPDTRLAMDAAWREVHTLMPQDTSGVERKPPHLTLRFIGSIHTATNLAHQHSMRELEQTLFDISSEHRPIPLQLGRINTFPGVVWLEVQANGDANHRLHQLADQIDRAVRRHLGLALQTGKHAYYRFRPHLTLATFQPDATESFANAMSAATHPAPLPFSIQLLRLMRSRRDRQGCLLHEDAGAQIHLSACTATDLKHSP